MKKNHIHYATALLFLTLFPLPLLAGTLLLEDSFTRPNHADINEGLPRGQSGALRNTPWLERQNPTTKSDNSIIAGNHLLIAKGFGESAVLPAHNFIDPIIKTAGGFKVTVDCRELINRWTNNLHDFYYGFGVGISKVEIAEWDVFPTGKMFRGTQSENNIKNKVGFPEVLGAADLWIGFSQEPALQICRHGQILESFPLNRGDGILEATFTLKNGFNKGDLVEVSLTINGTSVDIDPSTPGLSRTFAWSETDSNFIALEARGTEYAKFDLFKIELLRDVEITPGVLNLVKEADPTREQLSTSKTSSPEKTPSRTVPTPVKIEPRKIILPGTQTQTQTPSVAITPPVPQKDTSAHLSASNLKLSPIHLLGLMAPALFLLLRRK